MDPFTICLIASAIIKIGVDIYSGQQEEKMAKLMKTNEDKQAFRAKLSSQFNIAKEVATNKVAEFGNLETIAEANNRWTSAILSKQLSKNRNETKVIRTKEQAAILTAHNRHERATSADKFGRNSYSFGNRAAAIG